MRQSDGTFLVSVGLLGRSGEAVAESSTTEALEKAFLEAIARLHGKL